MSCLFSPNATFPFGYNSSFFAPSEAQNVSCPRNYLRPDPGGALLPWLFTLFLLLFHLPAAVLRVARWESAQYLALSLALFSVALCIQAYTSTKLQANQVLVWMPLTLLQDVGAMVQMAILIVEQADVQNRGGLRRLAHAILPGLVDEPPDPDVQQPAHASAQGEEQPVELTHVNGRPTINTPVQAAADNEHGANNQQHHANGDEHGPTGGRGAIGAAEGGGLTPARNSKQRSSSRNGQVHVAEVGGDDEEQTPSLRIPAYTCLLALVLAVMLVILQIYGIVAAAQALNQPTTTVNWCSPGFRDFAVGITTGNCEAYPIIDASSNGIGCVSLPALEQRSWLKATIGALSVSLLFEVADCFIILLARGKRSKKWKIDLNRPWLTIFAGILMLVILLVFGIFDASRLPPGITDVVWVYRVAPLATSGTVCRQPLTAPGLRGMIIGYTDGLLGGWGDVYYGYQTVS